MASFFPKPTGAQLKGAARPTRILTLADLQVPQIYRLLSLAHRLKKNAKISNGESLLSPGVLPRTRGITAPRVIPTMDGLTVGLIFTKRSTRTRLACELSASTLGGHSIFLGKDDIHLGEGESVKDTARVLGGVLQGLVARVDKHSDLEELCAETSIPILNALSDLWHPTQVLADLLTLHEAASQFRGIAVRSDERSPDNFPSLPPLTVAYVGDSTNVLHDMLVTYPRMGHQLRVATPKKYRAPEAVWNRVKELDCDKAIWWGSDPKEAVHGADVVVTDTWISMGQEAEKEQRLKDFEGYQVTEELCREGGAKKDWVFMHCLPRKPHEVDDDVFYGERSWVFREAVNRRWTMTAVFEMLFGRPRRMARGFVSDEQHVSTSTVSQPGGGDKPQVISSKKGDETGTPKKHPRGPKGVPTSEAVDVLTSVPPPETVAVLEALRMDHQVKADKVKAEE